MRLLSILLSALLAASTATAQDNRLPADLQLRPAAAGVQPRPWAIFFPRAEGIGELAPGNQYTDLAHFLNQRGLDVLIVDDDEAMKRLDPKGSAGEKRGAIAIDALARLRANGRFDARCPGIAVGWSRGGEGALTLASTATGHAAGFRAAVVYYPSVRGQQKPWPQLLPVLALQGSGDSIAPHGRLEALAAERIAPPGLPFIIKLYPGAKHRFDVAHPVRNPGSDKVEQDFDAAAHADALAAIDAFLDAQGLGGPCAINAP